MAGDVAQVRLRRSVQRIAGITNKAFCLVAGLWCQVRQLWCMLLQVAALLIIVAVQWLAAALAQAELWLTVQAGLQEEQVERGPAHFDICDEYDKLDVVGPSLDVVVAPRVVQKVPKLRTDVEPPAYSVASVFVVEETVEEISARGAVTEIRSGPSATKAEASVVSTVQGARPDISESCTFSRLDTCGVWAAPPPEIRAIDPRETRNFRETFEMALREPEAQRFSQEAVAVSLEVVAVSQEAVAGCADSEADGLGAEDAAEVAVEVKNVASIAADAKCGVPGAVAVENFVSYAGAVVEVSELSVEVAVAASVTHCCKISVDTGASGEFFGRRKPSFSGGGKLGKFGERRNSVWLRSRRCRWRRQWRARSLKWKATRSHAAGASDRDLFGGLGEGNTLGGFLDSFVDTCAVDGDRFGVTGEEAGSTCYVDSQEAVAGGGAGSADVMDFDGSICCVDSQEAVAGGSACGIAVTDDPAVAAHVSWADMSESEPEVHNSVEKYGASLAVMNDVEKYGASLVVTNDYVENVAPAPKVRKARLSKAARKQMKAYTISAVQEPHEDEARVSWANDEQVYQDARAFRVSREEVDRAGTAAVKAWFDMLLEDDTESFYSANSKVIRLGAWLALQPDCV
jgi:hypothetical protein